MYSPSTSPSEIIDFHYCNNSMYSGSAFNYYFYKAATSSLSPLSIQASTQLLYKTTPLCPNSVKKKILKHFCKI